MLCGVIKIICGVKIPYSTDLNRGLDQSQRINLFAVIFTLENPAIWLNVSKGTIYPFIHQWYLQDVYSQNYTIINWFRVFITYKFLFMTSFGIKISNLFILAVVLLG